MLLRLAAGALLAVALAGCGGSRKDAAPAPTGATTTAPGLPPGCSVAEIDAIVTRFLARPSFAAPGTFEVYATYESDGRKFLARSPARALAHVERRIRLGERSRLIQLTVGTQDFNHARITFQLTRIAPDFRQRKIYTRLVKGGGTIDCAHQKVAAWVTQGP